MKKILKILDNILSIILSYTMIYTILPIYVIIVNALSHNYIFLGFYILLWYLLCVYTFEFLVNKLREEFRQMSAFLYYDIYLNIVYDIYWIRYVRKSIKKYIVRYKLSKLKKGKRYESFK